MDPTAIGLMATKDLVAELTTRFDAMIFHGIIDRNGPSPSDKVTEIFAIVAVGDPHRCVGMAAQTQQYILNNLHTASTDGTNL